MYYCLKQEFNLSYIYQKIKFGNKKNLKSDAEKLNLKGAIKSIKLTCDKSTIEITEFNKNGNIIKNIKDGKTKITEYLNNLGIWSSITTNTKGEEVLIEYYKYNKKRKLYKKEVMEEIYYGDNYEELYDFDLRNNITSIQKVYDAGTNVEKEKKTEITNMKYDKDNNLIGKFFFVGGTYSGRIETLYKIVKGIKTKSIITYSSDENILFKKDLLLNTNNDVILIEFYSLMAHLSGLKKNNVTKYSYTYDDFGNWIVKEKILKGNVREVQEREIQYFY